MPANLCVECTEFVALRLCELCCVTLCHFVSLRKVETIRTFSLMLTELNFFISSCKTRCTVHLVDGDFTDDEGDACHLSRARNDA